MTLARTDSRELAASAGIVDARGRSLATAGRGDSVIIIHLGPDQSPEVARILRSHWPTITALNYAEDREFHVRLRQHRLSGVCLVYASVTRTEKNRSAPSIFGDVVQRGRLVRSPDGFPAAIAEIRRELGITGHGKLTP